MPAVAEQAVVGPVGRGRADGDHGDPVDQEHDHGEDRQAQPAVGDDAVDLIGRGLRGLGFLAVAGADDFRDVNVALVGDDGLGVVVELFLGGLDVRLDVLVHILGDVELGEHLVIALKDLDRVPALLLLRHLVHGRLFDVGDRVLDRAGERVVDLAASMAASAAAMTPSPFRAEISTTLQPSCCESWLMLIWSPLLRTMSIMFTAMTTGMPSSVSCVVRYRLRSRFVPSTMLRMASGRSSIR